MKMCYWIQCHQILLSSRGTLYINSHVGTLVSDKSNYVSLSDFHHPIHNLTMQKLMCLICR